MGGNICKSYLISKQQKKNSNLIKNEQKTWINIFPKKTNRWPKGTWKDLQLIISSVQFSRSVVSDSLRPHELQHTSPPCPSPTPGVYPNSCPSNGWWHPAISSSVVPFYSWPQSLPLFQWVNSSHQVAKVLEFQLKLHQFFQWTPRTDLFKMDWLDLLAVQGTLKSLRQHHSSKASIFWCSDFFIVQPLYPYLTTGKTIALIRWTLLTK